MAFKNRYFKNPVGINSNYSFIGITGAVEYSDSASFTAFVTESVAGEIGVFNAATGALISGAGAVSTTLEVFIAVNNGAHAKDGKNVIRCSEKFRVADLQMTRTPYAAPVKGAVAFDFTGATLAAGDEIGIKVLDLTIGGNPVTVHNFSYTVKSTDTLDSALAALAAVINDTASVTQRDTDPLVTAAYDSGTDVLTITNKDFGAITKVLLQEKLATVTSTTTVTKTVEGSGTYNHALLFQQAQWIKDGVTTNYPDTPMANPEDFGQPNSLLVSTGQYNHYTLKKLNSDTSKTNRKIDYYPTCLELVVNANGAANAEAEIKAILGL
jgi:hypothetical protein